MEMSRQERIELHDRYLPKLDGVRKSLMARFPGVVSVDLGLKKRHDSLTEELSWRIFVKEKKPESELAPEERLPKEIEGLPTDVQTSRVTRLDVGPDESSYSSLAGGIQINAGLGAGTLGCFVNVIGDTKVYLMSNQHVLVGYQGSVGKLVGQPSAPCDLCCCKCCDVATVTAASGMVPSPPGGTPNTVDAAIARLKGQNAGETVTPYTNLIVDIGPIFGSATAAFGDPVRKRGRTSLVTNGTIASTTFSNTVTLTQDPSPPTAVYTDCLDISPAAPTTDWSSGGDSGSAVVNATGQVVGLHFGGNGTSGQACKIGNITSRLNVAVLVSGTTGTVPHGAFVMEAPIAVANPATFLQKIEQKIKGAPGGEQFLHVVHENHREVLDLINDHREVKVAWNRFQGPAFVGHLAKNVNESTHRVPKEVNGYTLQHLLIKMSDVLERNGSRALAKAVEDYSAVAFNFADQYEGFDSIDTLIQKANLCPNCGQPQNLNPHAE